jgi:hypothetical protein
VEVNSKCVQTFSFLYYHLRYLWTVLFPWCTHISLRTVVGFFVPTGRLMRRLCLMGATVPPFCKLSSTSRCRSMTGPVLYVACGTWWPWFASSALSWHRDKGVLCCKLWRDRTLPRLLVSSSITSVVVTGLSIAAGAEAMDTGETVTDSRRSCS